MFFWLLVHVARRAASRAACTAGSNSPMSMPMMVMTTSSSISVNAFRERLMTDLLCSWQARTMPYVLITTRIVKEFTISAPIVTSCWGTPIMAPPPCSLFLCLFSQNFANKSSVFFRKFTPAAMDLAIYHTTACLDHASVGCVSMRKLPQTTNCCPASVVVGGSHPGAGSHPFSPPSHASTRIMVNEAGVLCRFLRQ